MALPRLATSRSSFRTFGAVWGQAPRLGHRPYVTAQPHEAEKGSDLPWLIGSLALGVPLVTYLMQTGPEKKVHYGHFRPEVREALEKGHPIQSADSEKPSAIDPAQATKFPEGPGTISHKQVGLDNYNSSNPAIAIAGKSVKGEGDTDSTKLQGTVDPGRRQA